MLLATLLHLLLLRVSSVILGAGPDLSYLSEIWGPPHLQGKSSEEIFYVIAQEDIRAACDLLRQVYDDSQRTDGFVSLEESPHIAHDTEASVRDGHHLWELIDRPNLFVKVPATSEGIPAVKELLADGVNV